VEGDERAGTGKRVMCEEACLSKLVLGEGRWRLAVRDANELT